MIIVNLNENLTTDLILKNITSVDNFIIFESTKLKGAYDYEDCCCGETCSCGQGHNRIELNDKMTALKLKEKDSKDSNSNHIYMDETNIPKITNNIITDNIITDNTIINDLNNVIIENLIFAQSDINIPLITLKISVIILIGLVLEVCNASQALRISKKFFGWKKDNNKSGPKYLDAPVSWGLYFQDAASPSFEGIVDLHNRIMFYLVVILFGVSWVLLSVITNFNNTSNKLVYRHLNHGSYVPVQRYSKLINTVPLSLRLFNGTKSYIFNSKSYKPKRYYTSLSDNLLNWSEINYVKVYKDAYLMRKIFLEDNKGKSGIYMLTNKLTNHIYIGQSRDISKRFTNYFNPTYIKSKDNFMVSRALIKYGYSNFSITILEYCDKSDLMIRE